MTGQIIQAFPEAAMPATNAIKLYRQLATDAAWIADRAKKLQVLISKIQKCALAKLPHRYEYCWDGYPQETLSRCRDALAKLDRDYFYFIDANGCCVLRPDVVHRRLAVMVKAVTGSDEVPDKMLDYVLDISDLTYPALFGACQQIETECETRELSIALVLRTIRGYQTTWSERIDAMRCIEQLAQRAGDLVALLEEQLEIYPQYQAKRQAQCTVDNLHMQLDKQRDDIVKKQQAAADKAKMI